MFQLEQLEGKDQLSYTTPSRKRSPEYFGVRESISPILLSNQNQSIIHLQVEPNYDMIYSPVPTLAKIFQKPYDL